MGNKCSSAPSFTSEIIIEEDEPPDPPEEEGIAVTLLETKHFSFAQLESKNGGKLHALVRVSSSFNSQVYTKPVRSCSKDGIAQWHVPKRRFFVSVPAVQPVIDNGQIKVSLLSSHLPPLPAVPSIPNESLDRKGCKTETLASLTINVTLDELKNQSKRVERWLNLETTDGEQSQVLVALDYVYRTHHLKAGQTINDRYEIENVLGSGQSVVKKATHKVTKKEYAIKFISKRTSKGQTLPRCTIDKEIELLRSLSHGNIVQLHECWESDDTVYVVMELVKGSDLYDVVSILGTIRPGVAGAIVGQVLSALAYLHSRGLVHHDIKMENVIVDYLANKVKLTDFGSAKEIKNMSGVGGTINYMAPELIMNMRGGNQKCDQSVDIWSVGIVAYMMLSGFHPFDHSAKANQNIMNRIISGKFDFPSPQWDAVPKHCKDFIRRCLVVDPKSRPSVAELLKHPWITSSVTVSCATTFSKKEGEQLEFEKTSRSNSRSNSMGSLLELFGNNPCPTRS